MKKYIFTVKVIIKGILFDSKKKFSQIIETDNIGEELIEFQDTFNELYPNKIIIEEIEYKEII